MFALLAATGELWALRPSWREAFDLIPHAELYLDGAATCGHPAGPAYAAKHLPFRITYFTLEEVEEALDGFTPVLDREP